MARSQLFISNHPSAEALEDFALGRASSDASIVIEEHMLVCEGCANQITAVDSIICALKLDARHPKGLRLIDIPQDPRMPVVALRRRLAPLVSIAAVVLIGFMSAPLRVESTVPSSTLTAPRLSVELEATRQRLVALRPAPVPAIISNVRSLPRRKHPAPPHFEQSKRALVRSFAPAMAAASAPVEVIMPAAPAASLTEVEVSDIEWALPSYDVCVAPPRPNRFKRVLIAVANRVRSWQ